MKFIAGLFFLLIFSIGYAKPSLITAAAPDVEHKVVVNVDLFLVSTCPHCHEADAFFREMEKKSPWLIVHRYTINQDKAGLKRFYDQLQLQHADDFSVPAMLFCNARWTGYSRAEGSDRLLLKGLNYCHQQLRQHGKLNQGAIQVLQEWGAVTRLQSHRNGEPVARTFIPLTALTDAFSSCSLFCFLVFFAFIWLYPTQKWQQFGLGMTFMLTLSVVHYLQQMYPAIYFQTLPRFVLFNAVIGVLLLIYAWDYCRHWRSPRMRFSVLPYLLLILVAFVVYVNQQACGMNVNLVFEQWRAGKTLSMQTNIRYQLAYQFFYLLPLMVLLLSHFIFVRWRHTVHYQSPLKIAACVILVSIAILLVLYPLLLTNGLVSWIVLAAALLLGYLKRDYVHDSKGS